ncbi:Nuclear fragile X mental retardation-interacting protein 1 [Frankliniella fusca]|uniref:Nuclear fragile X mental retardation-interacting protein 1 n=1 Tax=Frankliniella fusca TaxID=407009 RepID=A0AAE1I4M1_9NEOP|nr:Nuclear fragile X mental retardation-interacting protein 1 [Frankliniella fusca]
MGLARGSGPHRGGGRGSGRGVHKKSRGGLPMMRAAGPAPLMGPPGPRPPMGGPRMRPPPPGLMHQPPGVRPPPPGMRPPRPPLHGPHGMVRPPPHGFRPPPGPHGPHGPMGPHGPRMGPPGMPHRPPPPGMMRGRGGMMRPPMMPPRFGPPGHPGPPGPLGIPPLGPPMGPPFMMRLARGGRRGGMAGKGGKNRKMKGKSGTNRPQAELEAAELAKPWVNDVIRPEIVKKHKLHAEARASKDVKDWEAFKEQKKKVAVMVNEAKLEYIGSHPEEVTDEADDSGDEGDEDDENNDDNDDNCEDWQHGAEENYNPAHGGGHDEQNGASYEIQWNWNQDPYYSYYASQSTNEATGQTDISLSAMSVSSSTVPTHHYQHQPQDANNQLSFYNAASAGSADDYYGYYNSGAYNDGSVGLTNEPQQYQIQETNSQYNHYGYYDPATQSYGVCGEDQGYSLGYNQWYNQEYEQVYASYQQYSVPYQQHQNDYSNTHVHAYSSPSSYASTKSPRDLSNKNRQNGNFIKRFDEPLSLFYCESCDRSFANDGKLQEHLSEHRTCGIDGCKFTAHTKVVDNHIRMQHDTGLYRRMINNDDTQKWRAERKKKYPSQANIEARQLQQQEMMKRGERLGFHQNRSRNSRGRGGLASSSARGRGRPNPTSTVPLAAMAEVKQEKMAPSEWRPQFLIPVVEDVEFTTRGQLFKFPGTGNFKSDEEKVEEAMAASGALNTLCAYGAESSEDETDDQNNSKTEEKSEISEIHCEDKSQTNESSYEENNTSVSVMNEGGSESDGSAPEEMPISKSSCTNVTDDNISPDQTDKSGSTRKRKRQHVKHGEPKKSKGNTSAQAPPQATEKTSEENSASDHRNNCKQSFGLRGRGRAPFQNNKRIIKRTPTLLEKLLAPDIQHERNVILQCIRYVVEQKFFNIGQTSAQISAAN